MRTGMKITPWNGNPPTPFNLSPPPEYAWVEPCGSSGCTGLRLKVGTGATQTAEIVTCKGRLMKSPRWGRGDPSGVRDRLKHAVSYLSRVAANGDDYLRLFAHNRISPLRRVEIEICCDIRPSISGNGIRIIKWRHVGSLMWTPPEHLPNNISDILSDAQGVWTPNMIPRVEGNTATLKVQYRTLSVTTDSDPRSRNRFFTRLVYETVFDDETMKDLNRLAANRVLRTNERVLLLLDALVGL